MNKKELFIVIAYDIVSNRRRGKIVKELKNYGRRVNYSVFECCIGKKDLKELKRNIKQLINTKKDSVLIYNLCMDCVKKSRIIGLNKSGYNENKVIII